jgi:hypothetical protein
MRPKTLAKQAGIPVQYAEEALKLLEAKDAVEFEWGTNWDGVRARTFIYRILVPDAYKPELTAEALRA